MYYGFDASSYLEHYGVKGMKWGIRRYQNADGSLTEAGKKKYGKMSDDKLAKTLKKQVKRRRGELHGKAEQWHSGLGIGEYSKKALDRERSDRRKYEQTDSFTKVVKQMKDLDRKFDSGKIDPEQYDSEFEKLRKKIYDPKFDSSVTYGNKGKEYVDEYVNGYGKDITIGYLRDLGYNQEVSEMFVKRMLKSKTKIIY